MRVAVAILFLIATAIEADSNLPSTVAEIEITDLEAGRLLIAADRLKDARVFLERAQPRNEEEWIERLFLLGRVEMRLGMPRSAVERFKAILERHPDLTRVQLELAAAYYASGIDDKAKLHFKSSLSQKLPFSVEASVMEFLRQIDARKPWSASFAFSLLPESNPSRSSELKVVSVGGLPFELDQESMPSSGVGGLFSGGLSRSSKISANLRGLLAISGAAKIYERSEWNDVTIAADIGLSQLTERGSMSEGFRFGWQWIGGERFRRSLGIWTQIRWRMSESVGFDLPVSLDYRKYDTQTYRDGPQLSFNPKFSFAINDRTLIGIQPLVEIIDAKTAHHKKDVVGIGLELRKTFENGFSISLNPSFNRTRHAAKNPLFDVKRLDKQFVFSVGLSSRSIQYKGFTPAVSYVYERNQSNIAVNEYRNHGLNFNLSRIF